MTTVTTLNVTGMTCGHCASAVTGELGSLADVQDVSVELHAGAVSKVSVISDQPLPEAPLRDAVGEAGYAVESVEVLENAVAAESSAQAPARQAHRTLPLTEK